jgi:2-C-methyl-D-erythritol 4-phosphate cytidylyltransferase
MKSKLEIELHKQYQTLLEQESFYHHLAILAQSVQQFAQTKMLVTQDDMTKISKYMNDFAELEVLCSIVRLDPPILYALDEEFYE